MKLALALITVYLLWGSSYLAAAVTNRSLPPLLMLSVRFLIAGALLYAWASWRGHVAAERPGRRQWGAAALVGALLLVVDSGGVTWAQQRVASGIAALLVASVPLFIAALDRAIFGIRLGFGAAAGIATGLLGVGLLVGPSANIDLVGAGVILLGSLAWAVGSLYARVAPMPQTPVLATAMQLLSAGVLLGIAGLAVGEGSRVHPGSVSLASFAAFLFLIVFSSIVAFTVYGWLLQNASTSLASTYAYVNPAVAVFLGWAVLGEHVGSKEIASGVVILASVAMIVFGRGARVVAEPTAESLAPYIRRQDARLVEFPRAAPRLVDLRRIAA
jgi:drug/metabolite transporter (DMT)-like permease